MIDARRVLIVLHGDRADISELPSWAKDANDIIAADGGADVMAQAGLQPVVVLGDMDSISESSRQEFADKILLLPEQNSTDFQKALAYAIHEIDGTDLAVFGAEGSRIDHTLSALGAAAAFASDFRIRFAFSSSIVHVVRATLDEPRTFEFKAKPGLRVSVIALLPAMVRASSGLKWPLEGLELAPGVRDGISNEALGESVVIELEAGCLAVFVSRLDGDIGW